MSFLKIVVLNKYHNFCDVYFLSRFKQWEAINFERRLLYDDFIEYKVVSERRHQLILF